MLTMKEPRLSGVSRDEKLTREIPSMDISHVMAALRQAELVPTQSCPLHFGKTIQLSLGGVVSVLGI